MLRSVKRYVRERFERKVVNKPDGKVNTVRKPKPVRYCRCRTSTVPDYLKCVSKNFGSQFLALKHNTEQRHNDSSHEFKSNKCLDPSWIETFGLSGTLAFGWSLSQNVELKRKQLVNEIVSLHYNEKCPLKSVLCPYSAVKNVFPKPVLTQPNKCLQAKINGNDTKIQLPVFGPLTAEETLNEAKKGLEKARNTAIAEIENRKGLRCMSNRRYRRAMAHFAASSALKNSSAIFNLAQCYELGLGTPKDLTKAAKCYHASSELGNATATFNLAVYYAQGLGGLKLDTTKARELLQKAVELGEPQAKAVLDSRLKRQEVLKSETSDRNSTTQIDRLVESVEKLKVTPFPEMNANTVTGMNQNKSISVLTKTCVDTKFPDSIDVSVDRNKKSLPNFSLLEVKGYADNIRNLPVTFYDPVLPRKKAVVAFHW